VARRSGNRTAKLGGQAEVKGVGPETWKDLTDNVNFMAANLTTQVPRHRPKVVTAVANGGTLKRKLVLETKGEIAEAGRTTINGMIDTLAHVWPTR